MTNHVSDAEDMHDHATPAATVLIHVDPSSQHGEDLHAELRHHEADSMRAAP